MNFGFGYDARGVRGWAAVLCGVVLVFGLVAGASGDLPKDRPAGSDRGLGPSTVAIAHTSNVNRVIMALTDKAEIGAIPGSVAGGGFWRATTDQYIFSSGVNIGATVEKPGGGLDTLLMLGGPFSQLRPGSLVPFQTRSGQTRPGADLGLFWVSTDPSDNANFPLVCTVDEFRVGLFPSLAPFLGQPFPGFADETVCVAANDVDGTSCSACGGTRLGAETNNTYFAFSIPAVQDYFFAILRVFNRSEFVTSINTPANSVFGPYDFMDTVVAVAIDPDLGDATDDQIGFLPAPINTMVWWDSDFDEPDFQFQPPGFGGVSYLKTPEVDGEEVGLQSFTVFTNRGARPDPASRQEWYEALTGDPNFVVFDVEPQDVRGMASSGQFPLPAGEFVEIYAAYFFAEVFGPTPTELTTNNAIVNGVPIPLFNNFVAAQAGVQAVFDAGFLVPTAPPSPTKELIPGDHQVTIVWDNAPVLSVNAFARVARDPFLRDETGQPDADAPGLGIFLDADQVIFVPALDTGGTSGFVTAGTAGLADAEVTNPFFDPDFVIQDFEGFRVYRSFTGTQDDAELIAQFDLANDIVEGEFCVQGTTVPAAVPPGEEPIAVICQVTQFFPLGTNTGLAFGVVDRGGAFPNPSDGPGLINGIPVYYAVTSYGVNCGVPTVAGVPAEFLPGPDPFDEFTPEAACLTLESGKNLMPATPRSNSTAFNSGATEQNVLAALRSDGSVCDESEPAATIDPATGEYVDFIECSNAIIAADFLPLRPLNLPDDADRFFVIDSITYPEYGGGPYGIAIGGGLVWYHWEDESGALATDMLPAVGNYRHNAIFGAGATTSVTTGFRADPTDVGPDLQIAFTIEQDYSVIEDLEINGMSAHKLELGGTHLGESRPHAVINTTVADLISIGNARGTANQREYSHPGPYAAGAHSYELTWSVSGGSFTGTVRSTATGEEVPLGGQPKGPNNPSTPQSFVAGYNWGFLGPDATAALRPRVMFGSPLTNTMNLDVGDSFVLFVPGQSLLIGGITDLPDDGDVWTLLIDAGYDRAGFGREDPTAEIPEWHYEDTDSDHERQAILNAYPGARWRVSFGSGGASNELADADLQQIAVVPNPFIAANEITRGRGRQRVLFTNLPPQATIRIYTISGNLVRILEHTDQSGTEEWDVRTRFDLLVASGNYYYHVTTPDGRTHLGRFAVIN